jgi:hypothetical protein
MDQLRNRDIAEHRTREVHALGGMLETLRLQLLGTLATPFFDEGPRAELFPVIKHGTTEVGTIKVTARKREPVYEATASIEVRCDHDAAGPAQPDTGCYQVRAKAAVACMDARGRTQREFVFAVHEIDGGLDLDVADLEAKLAEALRVIAETA